MKITILYDNESRIEGLTADWGFSCLIESHGVNLLFDTGTRGDVLLANMKALGVDPASIDEVFLSHSHFDHIGGLSPFLHENGDVKVYAPSSLRGIGSAREAVYVDAPMKLRDHFYTTGLLENIEQSLAIESDNGLVVIVGCSHPGVETIVQAVKQFGTPYALIGGLHGFDKFDALESIARVCPTHCTQHIAEIRSRYPDKYVRGGVGEIIDI